MKNKQYEVGVYLDSKKGEERSFVTVNVKARNLETAIKKVKNFNYKNKTIVEILNVNLEISFGDKINII